MTFQIKKATKSQSKLRMAVFGPSGSGKTMTSLRIAHGLAGTVGVIDTERGSAAKYSDRFPFDVIELEDFRIDNYTGAIHAFADAGHEVLVVDSLTHAWDWLLDFVDKLGATKYRGNKWSAWSEATPKQQALVDAILSYPGHVIATMRSKTEWVTETNDRGKSTPVRIGVAPKQRDGVEYEFDLLLEMNVENVGRFIKDRTGKFQDVIVSKPGEDLGRELAAWLSDGVPVAPAAKPTVVTPPSIDPDVAFPEEPEQPAAFKDELITGGDVKKIAAAMKPLKLDPDTARAVVESAIGREIPGGIKSLTRKEGAMLAEYDSDRWAATADLLRSPVPDEFPPEPDSPLFDEVEA